MQAAGPLSAYYEAIVSAGLFPSIGNLQYHLANLFEGVVLDGRRFLDVGGGDGIHSFYAACRGASEVVCPEPEEDGSTAGMGARFAELRRRIGLEQVRLEPVELQAFDAPGAFDVILLHDSVNHLDDWACENLLRDAKARETYLGIFRKLAALAAPGADLVVCDCARSNFFGTFGLRNPFVPTVNWAKHQAPERWAELLVAAGFERPRIRWSTPNAFGAPGRLLLGNPLASWFFKSHFCMKLKRAG